MEETILEILKKENRAYSVSELEELLGINNVDGLKELLKTLNKMEDELVVYRSHKNKYMVFNNSHLKIGTLIGNKKGFGFVDIEGDSDVYISSGNMNGAIHSDRVIVEIISKKGMDLEGRIVKVVDRNLKQVVGELYHEKNKFYIKSDENKLNIRIVIDKNKTLGAMDGHKVLVKITGRIKDNLYNGEVIKIIGHKNDPGVDILSIIYKYGINDVFSDEVMEEADSLPSEVLPNEYDGRRDLRDKMIFTIDGDDTKDIDDAISIQKLENGNYLLGVHIADVSYYVKEGSKLDDEAYERGTSVYLADRVIPMLPHKLSNGICSLNPNVDRLAISCEMEIDNTGNVCTYDIFESVIKSRKQMTYKKVNKFLEENIVEEGYEEFTDVLSMMAELADILRKNKNKRGYINFDINESKIIVNDDGEAIDVKLRERGIGENLIEDFMIVANETVATAIYFMELPFIYRVHGEPNEEKINNFIRFVNTLGYHITGKFKDMHPKSMQNILEQLKDKKEFSILSSLLLRSMQKAVYDKNNIGHYGLASKCYTHFTSPIRRYPDTTVHRLIRKYLFKHQIDTDTINYWDNKLGVLALHTSKCEQDAIACEREVDDMKKAEYMMKHIGETFDGIISSVMSFGLFVELPNLVEGLIKIDDLKDDKYIYDEENMLLKGIKTKKIYRLGDNIKVVVKNANKEAKTIDFEPFIPEKEKTV